jgi:polyphosphate kinase 2 (PPK2 family)
MPRDFSDTKLLERLAVFLEGKIKLARDLSRTWKEGRAFDKRRAAERIRRSAMVGVPEQAVCASVCLPVTLQAMDEAGKDGTIKHVMSGGGRVTSFKAGPTEGLDHDYLCRHAQVLPERGHIGNFRSHLL